MKKESSMKLSVVTVSPPLAEWFLRFNTRNRSVKAGNVEYWKSVLKSGSAKLTHQGVAISGTAENPIRLIDGQHRLMAIVDTGIPMELVLCENTPEESYAFIDSGSNRSMDDKTGIPKPIITSLNAFYVFTTGGRIRPTPIIMERIYEIVKDSLMHVHDSRARNMSSAPIITAFICQQKAQSRNDASFFQGGIFESLSESLKALYRRQSQNPIRSTGSERASLFCVTWNAIVNPTITRVRFSDSPEKESKKIIESVFPEFKSIKF